MTPRDTFAGRGYVITGAASGIGLATARLLKGHGARVALWDQNATALEQAAVELDAACATVDITQPDQVKQAMTGAAQDVGSIDGVVHCAGILRTGLFENVTIDTHRRILEVNLFGSALVTHSALPYLRSSRGSLILMCSVSAFYGPPEYASYGASKAGVLALAQALRVEHAGSGIHIGVVSPHSVNTPMLDEQNRKARFVQRFGTPHSAEDVARAILHGIERRHFMIWPGAQPRLIFWLSHFLNPSLSYQVMRRLWQWAGGAGG
jgi:NAD(P)-dependent dehydrogenase (short-subunit alcohol dehydrogenase family)